MDVVSCPSNNHRIVKVESDQLCSSLERLYHRVETLPVVFQICHIHCDGRQDFVARGDKAQSIKPVAMAFELASDVQTGTKHP